MEIIDARKSSTEVQQHNREQAVSLHQEGMSRIEIVRIAGVHYQTIGDWKSWDMTSTCFLVEDRVPG